MSNLSAETRGRRKARASLRANIVSIQRRVTKECVGCSRDEAAGVVYVVCFSKGVFDTVDVVGFRVVLGIGDLDRGDPPNS